MTFEVENRSSRAQALTLEPYCGQKVLYDVSGAGTVFCNCDLGLCSPSQEKVKLKAGERFTETITWDQREFSGPSDNGEMPGAFVQAGPYRAQAKLLIAGAPAVRASTRFSIGVVRKPEGRCATQTVPSGVRLRPATDMPVGTVLWGIAAADFNSDGKLDLAVSEYDHGVSVLMGVGTGEFLSPRRTHVATRPTLLAAADLDTDGIQDLVLGSESNQGADNAAVLLGTGEGRFRVLPYEAVTGWPRAVALADIDNDGLLDLLIGSGVKHGALSVGVNDRTHPFAAPRSYHAGPAPSALAAADFNRDGRLDVAVAAQNGGLHVLMGEHRAGFGEARDIAPHLNGADVALGDFNCDGKPDVVGLSFGGSAFALMGHGDGTFTPPQPFQTSAKGSSSQQLALGDVNGDRILDLVVTNYAPRASGHGLAILLGDGAGGFASPVFLAVGDHPQGVVLADVNGDQQLDVITANRSGSISLLLSIR